MNAFPGFFYAGMNFLFFLWGHEGNIVEFCAGIFHHCGQDMLEILGKFFNGFFFKQVQGILKRKTHAVVLYFIYFEVQVYFGDFFLKVIGDNPFAAAAG